MNIEKRIIAGPCSAESYEQVMTTAKELAERGVDEFRAGAWKPRTRSGEFEGYGKDALLWMAAAKREYNLRLWTEVAKPLHVEQALEQGVDCLWIGARTSGDPFTVQEIAEALRGTDVKVFVKNPIACDLQLWMGAIDRVSKCVKEVGAIHRGFKDINEKKYRNAPFWKVPIELKREIPDIELLLDPSHLAGNSDLIAEVMQKGLDLNFDGFIVETHCNPARAMTDAKQQVTPQQLSEIWKTLVVTRPSLVGELDELRMNIDEVDKDILKKLAERQLLTNAIGAYKKKNNIQVLQSNRYNEIILNAQKLGALLGLDQDFIKRVWEEIHQESVKRQSEL